MVVPDLTSGPGGKERPSPGGEVRWNPHAHPPPLQERQGMHARHGARQHAASA